MSTTGFRSSSTRFESPSSVEVPSADAVQWGRTPTQQQTDIAQDIFLKLKKHDYLEERTTTQPFCEHPNHQSFLADRFVEGTCPLCGYEDARGDQCDKVNDFTISGKTQCTHFEQCGHLLDPLDLLKPRCKVDGTTPVVKETKHVFLLLDKLQGQVEQWSQKATKEGAWSSNGISITESEFSVPRASREKESLLIGFGRVAERGTEASRDHKRSEVGHCGPTTRLRRQGVSPHLRSPFGTTNNSYKRSSTCGLTRVSVTCQSVGASCIIDVTTKG